MKIKFLVFYLLAFSLLLFLFGSAYLQLHQRLRSHIPADNQRPVDYGLVPELVTVSDDYPAIKADYFPVLNPKGGVVLVHGLGWPNGGKHHMLGHARYLSQAGYSTLAVDMRSFGDSEGEQIELGSQEWQDVTAGYRWLKDRPELQGKPVGLLGISMGGASVIIAAGKAQAGDFVIASVPYATVDELLYYQPQWERKPALIYGWPRVIAGKVLIPHPLNAKDYIGKIAVPVLLLGGTRDETVPIYEVRQLKALANEQAELVELEAGHDIHAEKPEEFEQVVLSFLEKNIN